MTASAISSWSQVLLLLVFCSFLLVGFLVYAFVLLFFILHTAARVTFFLKCKLDLIAPLLKTFLQWLPILLRMKSKFLTMAFRSLCELTLHPTSPISHTTHSLDVTVFQPYWPVSSVLDPLDTFLTEDLCTWLFRPLQHLSSTCLDIVFLMLLFKISAQLLSPEKALPWVTDCSYFHPVHSSFISLFYFPHSIYYLFVYMCVNFPSLAGGILFTFIAMVPKTIRRS